MKSPTLTNPTIQLFERLLKSSGLPPGTAEQVRESIADQKVQLQVDRHPLWLRFGSIRMRAIKRSKGFDARDVAVLVKEFSPPQLARVVHDSSVRAELAERLSRAMHDQIKQTKPSAAAAQLDILVRQINSAVVAVGRPGMSEYRAQ